MILCQECQEGTAKHSEFTAIQRRSLAHCAAETGGEPQVPIYSILEPLPILRNVFQIHAANRKMSNGYAQQICNPIAESVSEQAEQDDQSQGATPLRKRDYLWLGEDHCRVEMVIRPGSVADRRSKRGACSRMTASCVTHGETRDERTIAAAYPRLTSQGGKRVCGKLGDDPLTRQQYEALTDD